MAEARAAEPAPTRRLAQTVAERQLVPRHAACVLPPPQLAKLARARRVPAEDHLAVHRPVPQMVAVPLVARRLPVQRAVEPRLRRLGPEARHPGDEVATNPRRLRVKAAGKVVRGDVGAA
eukprot:5955878-Prymnesium_polylepis.2